MPTPAVNEILRHLDRSLRDGGKLTDGQLLECFVARRDGAALEALVRRHGPMVWGVCRRILNDHHEAEDAFQATFLVLVRRAASVVPRERVGNWLYGVAFQTARRARGTAVRRRVRERSADAVPEPAVPPEDAAAAELRSLLDREIRRLPDKYRAPVVLCDLEGMTHQEAARQLGWPAGTVSGRLVRARALLARRLTRRGVALSAGAVAAVMAQEEAAAVPPALLTSTIKAVTAVAAGQATGLASAGAVALTKRTVQAMFLSKVMRLLTAVLIGAAFVGGTGRFLSPGESPESPEQTAAPAPSAPQPTGEQPRPAAEPAAPRITAYELGQACLTNEALVDEKLRGKRFQVMGRMVRIRRKGVDADNHLRYELQMRGQAPTDPQTGRSQGDPRAGGTLLSFEFSDQVREQLAKLIQGQLLTLEGELGGHEEKGGVPIIYLFDCKIVQVHDQ